MDGFNKKESTEMKEYNLHVAMFPDIEDVTYLNCSFPAEDDFNALLVVLYFARTLISGDYANAKISMDDVRDNYAEALDERDMDSSYITGVTDLVGFIWKYVNEFETSMVLDGPDKTYDFSGNLPAKPTIQHIKWNVA